MVIGILAIGVLALLMHAIAAFGEGKDAKHLYWGGLLYIVAMLCVIFFMGLPEEYDKGQVDALKGIQTHEIRYVFPQGDTIPCDTLYVKIK